MNTPANDPRPIAFSMIIYSTLLVFYPARFRQEYGIHMVQVFRDCCRKTYRTAGIPGMLWLWAVTIFDYLQSLIEEHSQKGVHMNREKYIRLSGWAFILGAFAWVLAWAINDIQQNNPYNAFTLSLGKYVGYLYGSMQFLLPSAIFLTSLGTVGLYLRYSKQAGRLGRSGLVIALGGGASALLTYGLQIFTQFEDAWYGFVIVVLLTYSGLTIFGIAALRNHLLPRWNLTPLLTGLCGFLSISGLFPLIFFTAVGFFILGYLLQSDPVIIAPQPATG